MVNQILIPLGNLEGNNPIVQQLDDSWVFYPPGWYDGIYYSLGIYLPLATRWEAAPKPIINVFVGDTIQVTASFKYRGPIKTNVYTLYCALGFGSDNAGTGNDAGSFNEGSPEGRQIISVPDATDWVALTRTVDVIVPGNVWMGLYYLTTQGRKLAIYCKIIDGLALELDKTLSPYYRGALNVLETVGEFSELKITNYVKKV